MPEKAHEKKWLDQIFDRLFPILRSITGDGIEESFKIMGEFMPLEIFGINSGERVFDWTTPMVWNCRSAELTDPEGNVICNLFMSNLHVLNYSEAVDKKLTLAELQPHLYSLPHLPTAIPYVTSYYKKNWGFCITQKVRDSLKDGIYHAKIDTSFTDGKIPLAHTVIAGETKREIFLSSYLCHPSLANNELSGPLVLLGLYNRIKKWPKHFHTFRFILNPETIGSLCYLHKYGEHFKNFLDAGLVLTCLGGPDKLSYKTSRKSNYLIDKLAAHWKERGEELRIRPFSPSGGSDERQYCSPGFNLPVGQMARSIYGEYGGYHNSLDTKEFMNIDAIIDSIDQIERFLKDLDIANPYQNLMPFGEPQLGKHDLYPNVNSAQNWKSSSDDIFDGRVVLERILYTLSYSDGQHDLVDIAKKCNCKVSDLKPVIEQLLEKKILTR